MSVVMYATGDSVVAGLVPATSRRCCGRVLPRVGGRHQAGHYTATKVAYLHAAPIFGYILEDLAMEAARMKIKRDLRDKIIFGLHDNQGKSALQ